MNQERQITLHLPRVRLSPVL